MNEGSPRSGQMFFLWETDVTVDGQGGAQLRARRPVNQCDVDRVREMLGGKDVISREMVYRWAREGLIDYYQPGAKNRKDGKGSNAKKVFDVESVMRFRQAQLQREADRRRSL